MKYFTTETENWPQRPNHNFIHRATAESRGKSPKHTSKSDLSDPQMCGLVPRAAPQISYMSILKVFWGAFAMGTWLTFMKLVLKPALLADRGVVLISCREDCKKLNESSGKPICLRTWGATI